MRGLFVGRFQPFHAGHLAAVREIRRRAPEADLLLVIGSAEESYTAENPFTASERQEMIARALAGARVDRVVPVPVADIRRHALWVRYLEGLLPPFDRVYSHNPLTLMLFTRAGYATDSPPLIDRARLEGVRIREQLSRAESVSALVPPAVDRYLAEIGAADRLKALRPEGATARPSRHARGG